MHATKIRIALITLALCAWSIDSGVAQRVERTQPRRVVTPRAAPSGIAAMAKAIENRPDLVATVASYGGGTLYPVAVSVKNQGAGPSAPTTFRMTCRKIVGSSLGDACLSTITRPVPSIPAGQGVHIDMPFAPALHCPSNVDLCRVTAVVDVDDQIAESDEANNTKIYEIEPK